MNTLELLRELEEVRAWREQLRSVLEAAILRNREEYGTLMAELEAVDSWLRGAHFVIRGLEDSKTA